MKILLFYTGRLLNGVGGIERVFAAMANEFSTRGYEIIGIGIVEKEGKMCFEVNPSVKILHLEVKKKLSILQKLQCLLKRTRKQRHYYRNHIIDPKIADKIGSVIEWEKPDLIISFDVCATRVIKLYTKYVCPVIHMFHESPERILEKEPDETQLAVIQAECVQVMTPKQVAILKQYFKNRIVCIPNIVPQFDSPVMEHKENLIVHVGRVSTVKQQHVVIEAFAKIADRFPSWSVEMWGEEDWDKKYYTKCKKMIEKHGLQNRIRFCGVTDHIFGVLQRASVFAFPSKHEGFGLALTEAMSMGIVPIGYKSCSAVNELIKDGINGILAEDGVQAFANALAELMQDEKKRIQYGKQAREDMQAYAPQKVWDMWQALIEELVVDKNKR